MGSLDVCKEDPKDAARSGLALARLIAMIAAERPKAPPMLPDMDLPAFRQAFVMAGDDVSDVLDQPLAPDSSNGMLRPLADLARHVTIRVNCDDSVVWLVSGKLNRGSRLGRLYHRNDPQARADRGGARRWSIRMSRSRKSPASFTRPDRRTARNNAWAKSRPQRHRPYPAWAA